ncbi:MAG: hypothetical protein GC183_15910 [Thiobacillus sp.]|nr:hypothetical protein [Thiobacillus sp.]
MFFSSVCAGHKAHRPASGAMAEAHHRAYLAGAGAACGAAAGAMPPIICIHLAGSNGLLAGAGAAAGAATGAATGAAAWDGIMGKNGIGAACAGAGVDCAGAAGIP